MCLVGDNQIEVSRRKELPVFVVEKQGLNGGDDDFCPAPIIAILFVDDRFAIVRKNGYKGFLCLIFEFKAVNKKENPTGVAGSEKEFDYCSSDKGFTGAGCHFKKKTVFALFDCLLQSNNSVQLVWTQESKLVGLDVS